MSVRTHFGQKAIQIQRGIISSGKYELFLPFDIGRLPKGVRIIWCLTQNHTGHDLGEYDMRHDMSMAVKAATSYQSGECLYMFAISTFQENEAHDLKLFNKFLFYKHKVRSHPAAINKLRHSESWKKK